MVELYLAAVGGLALAVGLASRLLHRVPVTEPLLALVLGVVLGPEVAGVAELPPSDVVPTLSVAVEVSLAVSLMAVALRFRLDPIRRDARPLLLLLSVVLIGTAAVSAALAALVLGIPLAVAALLGAVLTPTDPILASSVVSGDPAERDLPERVRLLISVESGGNDSLTLLLVATGIAAATGGAALSGTGGAAVQLVWGLALGVAIGWLAGRGLVWSEQHRDIEHSAFLVVSLALGLFVLGAVELLGGSGLIAVFAAGLTYGHVLSESERSEEFEIQEAVNRYLVLPVFALLGVALPWRAWLELGWDAVAFVATLLVLRRLPLVLALRRVLGLAPAQAVFVGWFGPVGATTLYYLTVAVESGAVDGTGTIWAVATLAIAASTLIHGVTATPGRRWYVRAAERG